MRFGNPCFCVVCGIVRMRGGSFMSEKIVIYENPFRLKYGKLVNVGGDLLSEFF